MAYRAARASREKETGRKGSVVKPSGVMSAIRPAAPAAGVLSSRIPGGPNIPVIRSCPQLDAFWAQLFHPAAYVDCPDKTNYRLVFDDANVSRVKVSDGKVRYFNPFNRRNYPAVVAASNRAEVSLRTASALLYTAPFDPELMGDNERLADWLTGLIERVREMGLLDRSFEIVELCVPKEENGWTQTPVEVVLAGLAGNGDLV